MGEYAKEAIKNSTKIEAAIGIGIMSLITTYIIDSQLNGGAMPSWAMWTLGMLLATFFGVRLLAYFQYVLEMQVGIQKMKVQAEIDRGHIDGQIRMITAQVSLKDAEMREQQFQVMLKPATGVNISTP